MKLKKNIKVADLITQSEVNEVLEKVSKDKSKLESLVCLAVRKDGRYGILTTPIDPERLIYMLERAKFEFMRDTLCHGEEDED
jgi:hypothetical protein